MKSEKHAAPKEKATKGESTETDQYSVWISEDEAFGRIDSCENIALLDEIRLNIESRICEEDERQKTVESKANLLMSSVAVCISIIALLGTDIGVKAAEFKVETWSIVVMLTSVIIAFSFGILAAIKASFVSKIKTYYAANDDVYLNSEAIKRYGHIVASKDDPGVEFIEYRRLVIRNKWQIADRAREINNNKAMALSRAQQLFLYFLLSTLVVGVVAPVSHVFDAVVYGKKEQKSKIIQVENFLDLVEEVKRFRNNKKNGQQGKVGIDSGKRKSIPQPPPGKVPKAKVNWGDKRK